MTNLDAKAAVSGPAVSFDTELERELVARYFSGRRGVFVDIGAFDPVLGSQTWHLEQLGWGGLLVEPNAEMAAKLRTVRKARVVEAACGSPTQHGTTMTFQVNSSYSTLGDDIWEPGIFAHETRKVPVVTLDSLLEQSEIRTVDFVSIDVEGFEVNVLEGFSLERYRPALVLIEDHAHDRSRHRHMVGRAYKRVRRTGLNSWYVPKETDFPISLFGRLQFLRKFVLGVPPRIVKRRWRKFRARPTS